MAVKENEIDTFLNLWGLKCSWLISFHRGEPGNLIKQNRKLSLIKISGHFLVYRRKEKEKIRNMKSLRSLTFFRCQEKVFLIRFTI